MAEPTDRPDTTTVHLDNREGAYTAPTGAPLHPLRDEPTFRCGWRVHRPSSDGQYGYSLLANVVTVRRGEWKWMLAAEMYDAMDDESFAAIADEGYRRWAFDHIQRDLDTLARQLVAENEAGLVAVTDVPYDDVKAALYRWQKTKRDMQ